MDRKWDRLIDKRERYKGHSEIERKKERERERERE